jgi:hypothetical protein
MRCVAVIAQMAINGTPVGQGIIDAARRALARPGFDDLLKDRAGADVGRHPFRVMMPDDSLSHLPAQGMAPRHGGRR